MTQLLPVECRQNNPVESGGHSFQDRGPISGTSVSRVSLERVQPVQLTPKPVDRRHILRHGQMNLGLRQLFFQARQKREKKDLIPDSVGPHQQDGGGNIRLRLPKGKTDLPSEVGLGDGQEPGPAGIRRASPGLERLREISPKCPEGAGRADLLGPDGGKNRRAKGSARPAFPSPAKPAKSPRWP